MRFITEEELRDLYKKEPFTEYSLQPDMRITPGARQFLMDRGIHGFEEAPPKNRTTAVEKSEPAAPDPEQSCRGRRLYRRMKVVEAEFLAASQELLSRDVLLAQKLIGLGQCAAAVASTEPDGNSCSALCVQECTGIKTDQFLLHLEDCFDITAFHIQLAKGREIILLHRLRCALRVMELELPEFFDGSDDGKKYHQEAAGKINQLINTLSQLICTTVGGETCQKKP